MWSALEFLLSCAFDKLAFLRLDFFDQLIYVFL